MKQGQFFSVEGTRYFGAGQGHSQIPAHPIVCFETFEESVNLSESLLLNRKAEGNNVYLPGLL